jgi:HEXXH motif-containing protein
MRGVADNSPAYLRWVERVLNGILVCHLEESARVVSGSEEDVPGLIHASFPCGRMDTAEVLVHECAHQYFYMLQRVGPVDDGEDRELYWSAVARRRRPLSRILMAYHAIANVRLFYEEIRARGGADVAYVDTHQAQVDETVASLDEPLRDNPTLTHLGRGLYEPLAVRIAALAH